MEPEVESLARMIETGEARAAVAHLGLLDEIGPLPQMIESSSLLLRLTGLSVAAVPLVHGRDVRRGLLLAETLLTVARRAYCRERGSAEMAELVGRSADLVATGYARLGRHAEVVELARRVPPGIIDQTNGYQALSLSSRGADALIAIGKIDEAAELLDAARRYDDLYFERTGQRDANLASTKDRLAAAKAAVVDPAANLDAGAYLTESIDYLNSFMSGAEELSKEARAFEDHSAAEVPAKDAREREVVTRSSAKFREMADALGFKDELNRYRMELQAAGKILFDPVAGHAPEKLSPARDRVWEAQKWFERAGHELDAIDALWVISVISRRLGEHSAALDTMERVREVIERRRHGISDPLKTAALFTRYPSLHELIVLSALELGRVDQALSAMEASKGRAIAELRSARRRAAMPDRLSEETLAAGRAALRIDELTSALAVDYLSFFVADVETFAILATSTGSREVRRFDLSKERLRMLVRQVDPAQWSANYGATRVDRELGLLVDWVLPHLTAPVLVISPDDPIHNLPFPYLEVPGGRLIDRVTSVKVHGADDLRAIAEAPPHRPELALAAFIPARDEDEGRTSEREAQFRRLCGQFPIRIETIDAASFDAPSAARLTIRDGLLHFAAHGHWPQPRRVRGEPPEMPDPYLSSGILLSFDGQLPVRQAPRDGDLLSPKLVMDSQDLEIEGAVFGIQACVSGLSVEGRAGDALGLEWALLARGAATVVASHWNVHFTAAISFFERFYGLWLGEGMSRAEAYAQAMRSVRDDPELAEYGLEWSSFTLIGDWR